MVLGRGLLGSHAGEPKVACPLHKKTFSLADGRGLSDPQYAIRTFPVEVRGDDVFALLPPADALTNCSTRADALPHAEAMEGPRL
jgi:hypothetical protein